MKLSVLMVVGLIFGPTELFAACSVPTPTYFVSGNSGNDTWSGSLATPNEPKTDGPYRTLAKAQSSMRSSSTKTTTIRAGTYSVVSNWSFTTADNGETWVSYPEETAVLDGGG